MMANITEDYVSFETAKLLKEKGFPQEYDIHNAMVYNEEDYEHEYEVQRMVTETKLVKAGTLSSYPASVPEPRCYCPTLQMAMKWLRETHNLHICIEPHSFSKNNKPVGYECTYWFNGSFYYPYAQRNHPLEYKIWDTYEDAVIETIKYCLTEL